MGVDTSGFQVVPNEPIGGGGDDDVDDCGAALEGWEDFIRDLGRPGGSTMEPTFDPSPLPDDFDPGPIPPGDVLGLGKGPLNQDAARAEIAARGGTYKLVDPETGQVMRTGRTNDLGRREAEHAKSFPGLNFEIDRRTDDYASQRGREQIIHDQYNPPLNKISPIDPNNGSIEIYIKAGQKL